MSDSENKKTSEELTDEALDAVVGGFGLSTRSENGYVLFTCSCGTVVSAPEGTKLVQCPNCKLAWSIMGENRVIPGMV